MKPFIGKQISVLDNKLKERTIDFFFLYDPPDKITGVCYQVQDSIFIEVYISIFKYNNPINEDLEWDFESIKKETISKIIIVQLYQNKERKKIIKH